MTEPQLIQARAFLHALGGGGSNQTIEHAHWYLNESELSNQAQTFLRERFGLEGHRPHSLEELAMFHHSTPAYIAHAIDQALEFIRQQHQL